MNIEPSRRAALYTALGRLQAALETADLWDDERPAEHELSSAQPFCYDTLPLNQWLQWLFIPRLRTILDQDGRLPSACAIYPYAEDFLDAADGRHGELLMVIRLVDELLSAPGKTAN